MKDPFVYQPPNEITAPKYATIRKAEIAAANAIDAAIEVAAVPHTFDEVNAACRDFAEVIGREAPPSADTTTAIRCVRLARMRANESFASGIELDWRTPLVDARVWACAAVALNTSTPEP